MTQLVVATLLLLTFFSIISARDGVAVTFFNYNSFPLSVYWDGGKDPSTGDVIETFIDKISPSRSIVVNTFVGVYVSYDHSLLCPIFYSHLSFISPGHTFFAKFSDESSQERRLANEYDFKVDHRTSHVFGPAAPPQEQEEDIDEDNFQEGKKEERRGKRKIRRNGKSVTDNNQDEDEPLSANGTCTDPNDENTCGSDLESTDSVSSTVLHHPQITIMNQPTTAMTARFRCLSPSPVDYYYFDGRKGTFQGTLTVGKETSVNSYEGHVFFFTLSGKPNHEISRFIMDKNLVLYVVRDVNNPAPADLEKMVLQQDAYDQEYFNRTGMHWRHHYGVEGPRPPPTLHMWPADSIGQIHTVVSKQGFWRCNGAPAACQSTHPLNLTLQVASLTPRVFLIPEFLSAFEADHIIELAKDKVAASTVGNGTPPSPPSSTLSSPPPRSLRSLPPPPTSHIPLLYPPLLSPVPNASPISPPSFLPPVSLHIPTPHHTHNCPSLSLVTPTAAEGGGVHTSSTRTSKNTWMRRASSTITSTLYDRAGAIHPVSTPCEYTL